MRWHTEESTRWYIRENGETTGPFNDQTVAGWVREGRLGPATRIAVEGAEKWTSIGQSPFGALTAAPASPKGLSTAAKVLVALGAAPVLLFGSCVVCGAIGAVSGHSPNSSTAPPVVLTRSTSEPPTEETPTALPATNLCKGAPLKSTGDIVVGCKEAVRNELKAPSTADFEGIMSTSAPSTLSNCDQAWRSWVEASNSFGAQLRTNFVCTYHRESDTFEVKLEE